MDFLAIWQFGPALFACKAPYHLDLVRKNADPLLFSLSLELILLLMIYYVNFTGGGHMKKINFYCLNPEGSWVGLGAATRAS